MPGPRSSRRGGSSRRRAAPGCRSSIRPRTRALAKPPEPRHGDPAPAASKTDARALRHPARVQPAAGRRRHHQAARQRVLRHAARGASDAARHPQHHRLRRKHSGCVRATAVDAYSHGYHVVLVEECCFDRIDPVAQGQSLRPASQICRRAASRRGDWRISTAGVRHGRLSAMETPVEEATDGTGAGGGTVGRAPPRVRAVLPQPPARHRSRSSAGSRSGNCSAAYVVNNALFLAAPTQIVGAIVNLTATGELQHHIAVSGTRIHRRLCPRERARASRSGVGMAEQPRHQADDAALGLGALRDADDRAGAALHPVVRHRHLVQGDRGRDPGAVPGDHQHRGGAAADERPACRDAAQLRRDAGSRFSGSCRCPRRRRSCSPA